MDTLTKDDFETFHRVFDVLEQHQNKTNMNYYYLSGFAIIIGFLTFCFFVFHNQPTTPIKKKTKKKLYDCQEGICKSFFISFS